MKKTLLKIFIIVAIVSTIISTVLFFANSAPIVKMIIDKYAPEYSITYKSIDGNLIRDLHIKDIRYKNEPLAKNATLSWSPWAILEGQIFLHTLDLEDVDVGVIQKLTSELKGEESNTSKERINLDIAIKSSNITFMPFVLTKEISVDSATLKMKQALFSIQNLTFTKGDLEANIVTNFGTIAYGMAIDEKQSPDILGKIYPKQTLYDQYSIPIKAEAVSEIAIRKFNLDAHKFFISLEAQGKGALFAESYAVDISYLLSNITYNFDTQTLNIDSNASLSGKDFQNARLTNKLTLDDTLRFEGVFTPEKISLFNGNSEKLFDAMQMTYRGDAHSLDANITSELFRGEFTSKEYKDAHLKFASKEPIMLASYIELPQKFKDTFLSIAVDAPINLRDIDKSKIDMHLQSNIIDADADIALNKVLHTEAVLHISKDTLLKTYNDTINWTLLEGAKIEAEQKKGSWDIALRAKGILADVNYNNANIKGKITIDEKPIDNLKIDTTADIALEFKKKTLLISMQSLKIGDAKIDQKEIKDITLQLAQETEGSFVIPSYSLNYKDIPLFANKPSYFHIKGDQFTLKELWINDQALAKGSYDIASKNGDFTLQADTFTLQSKLADVEAKADFHIKLNGDNTEITGALDIINGEIKYNFEQKSFPSDSDIVIIQDIHYKEPSQFVKNLTTNIKVRAINPITYKQKNADISAVGNLSINKVVNTSPIVTGIVRIQKESSYSFQEKRFILKESYIYFVGEYNKPLLDIKADYKSSNYKITVSVTGTPSVPNITFSSRPRLSQEQILAVLLFGSEDAAGTHSGTEMMKMLGGAIAKSALQNVGIKVDHLLLGADTFEVGKKLSDKVTVIYVNDEVSKVKVQYDQTKTVEDVLTVSPESTSIDIYYKKEFENMGDILYRKKD
ncbi:MAG: translocation/assembly module TamB domain-containing protein [Campylobacterales bacterium]|nr:translocation/assembly module TamB domain-containing protein [Campylobacterales bacterium]